MSFEAFAVSVGVVALGEIGDKTQLLALLLAARFRRPLPIIAGIFVATVANHALASALGTWITQLVDPIWMRWILGVSFLAVAAWMLVPDSTDGVEGQGSGRLGVFGVTVIAFFLAEMGDKTQIATVMLAAKYNALVAVTAGTTLGMMIANAPVVFLGDKITQKIPIHVVHRITAVIFLVIGVYALWAGA